MDENIISFTKINISQLKVNGEIKHELITSDFIERLEKAIKSDVSKNQVNYDSKKGTYEIYHNGKKYDVFYGDKRIKFYKDKITGQDSREIDTAQILNSLVSLSDEQKKVQEFNGNIRIDQSRTIEEIMENGDKGIFYSEDDKVKYIEETEKKISFKNVFKSLSKIFTESYHIDYRDDRFEYVLKGSYLIGILGMVGGFIAAFVTSNFWFILILVEGAMEFFLPSVIGYSLLTTLGQVIYRAFKWSGLLVAKTIKRMLTKRRLKQISKSIVESELSEYMSEKTPEKKIESEEKKEQFTLKGESKNVSKKILLKLPLIKDKERANDFACRLDELIDMCRDVKEEEYNARFSSILYQLSRLDGEISDEIKKELETHVITSDYQKTKEQVENVSDQVTSYKAKR